MSQLAYSSIEVEIDDHVCTVTMRNPEFRNALTEQMREELRDVFRQIASDPEVRAVVLTGSEKAFSAGGDLKALKELDASQVMQRMQNSQDLIRQILSLPKPVIAAVNGAAAGAGFSLALACDFIYAAKSAVFVQSFVKIGVVPDLGSLLLLPQLAGRHKAMEMMLLGEKASAEEMKACGVVSRVCADGQLLQEAQADAKTLAQHPRFAMQLIKQMVNEGVRTEIEGTFNTETMAQGLCFGTEDFKEGMDAFLNKRKPIYR